MLGLDLGAEPPTAARSSVQVMHPAESALGGPVSDVKPGPAPTPGPCAPAEPPAVMAGPQEPVRASAIICQAGRLLIVILNSSAVPTNLL